MAGAGNPVLAPVTIIVRSMGRASLRRALASIDAQETLPREVVVVAACGQAHPPLPAMHPAVQVRMVMPPPPHERLPRAMAANVGLDAASSEWIGFLDDDDELLPNHLATLVPVALAAYKNQGSSGRLVYSLSQGVDSAGNNADVYGRSFTLVQIWESTILTIMNALFHRSLLAAGCRVDETLDLHEDWDFWLQCLQHTTFTHVETITSVWHGTEGQSGCGFGGNYDNARYKRAQEVVRSKWAPVRDRALAGLQASVRQAAGFHAAGDIPRAIQLCQQILRQDPENVNAANLLGMISLYRGDLTSAQQLLDVAVRNGPPHFGLFYNRGLVEEALGNRATAAEWFAKGLALNPDHPGLRAKVMSAR